MRLYKTKKSKIDNFGLYATKDIKKGTKIMEYKGKVITRKEAEENPKYDNDKAIIGILIVAFKLTDPVLPKVRFWLKDS